MPKPAVAGFVIREELFAQCILESSGDPHKAERLLRRYTVGSPAEKDAWCAQLRAVISALESSKPRHG